SHPLFVEYAPRAPHLPTIPNPAYASACSNVPKITSRPTFNKPIVNGPAYMRALAPWSATRTAESQTLWRRDCQTLLSVDNQVGRIVRALQATRRLQNTLIVFASDNGFLFGQHRWFGKVVPYEGSIRVPIVVRDDAVIPPALRGTAVESDVTSLDYTPTFLQAAGTSRPLDGQSLFPLFGGPGSWIPQDPLLIEHLEEPARGPHPPSYCGVRTSEYMYAQYSTGEEELYDVKADPYEKTNVVAEPAYASVLDTLRTDTHELCDPTPPGFTWSH
ncbi:MAG TPA: sulfatase/phosphatase domain-containing protein, partial [Actinomycetota bacterium]|nr:sulfatase/phosphatase domain-containing protein [Actinomycetota bacterium]